jgi:7-carboxy-7-deazaguanine synthase
MPELIGRLLGAGKRVVVETNGATDISDVPDDPMVMISMDVKCPSSGMTDRMLDSNMKLIKAKDQLKYVIADDADYEFAVRHLRAHSPEAGVIFTPVGGTERLEWLVAKVLEDGIEARVLPQLHKIIWGDRKGV